MYTGQGSASACDVSPDGRTLLFAESDLQDSHEYLWVLDLESGQAKRWIDTPAAADSRKVILIRVMQSEPGKSIRIVDNWWP